MLRFRKLNKNKLGETGVIPVQCRYGNDSI